MRGFAVQDQFLTFLVEHSTADVFKRARKQKNNSGDGFNKLMPLDILEFAWGITRESEAVDYSASLPMLITFVMKRLLKYWQDPPLKPFLFLCFYLKKTAFLKIFFKYLSKISSKIL